MKPVRGVIYLAEIDGVKTIVRVESVSHDTLRWSGVRLKTGERLRNRSKKALLRWPTSLDLWTEHAKPGAALAALRKNRRGGRKPMCTCGKCAKCLNRSRVAAFRARKK